MRFIFSCNSRKNMQRNKQVNMGRKKFNMDPKKVGDRTSDLVFHEQLLTLCPVSAIGDPVHDREWLAEEYQWRHRAVPPQGRGPQQNGHWRLPWREVTMLFFPLIFSVESYAIHPCGWYSVTLPEHIFHSSLQDTPILSQRPFIIPTLRPSSQEVTRCSKAHIWFWWSYSSVRKMSMHVPESPFRLLLLVSPQHTGSSNVG